MLGISSNIWPWGTSFLAAVVNRGGNVALFGALGFVLPLIGIVIVAVLPRQAPQPANL